LVYSLFFPAQHFLVTCYIAASIRRHRQKKKAPPIWPLATLLIPCISSAQLNAYNFANSFILLSSGCNGSEKFKPTLAFYSLTLLALLSPTIGNFVYLNLTYKKEIEDLISIKSLLNPKKNNKNLRNLKNELLNTNSLSKQTIKNIVTFLSNDDLKRLKLTNAEQLKDELQRHRKSSILKLLITQILTIACIYPCYQSSMNYYEYSKISTEQMIQYFTKKPQKFTSFPLLLAYMSLIINTIIAAVCLKNCIIKPLLRKPKLNKNNLVTFLLILIPSASMSAPMAMLTYIDDSLNNMEKISIALFSAILTFTFALPGLQNLVNTLCFNRRDTRDQTIEQACSLLSSQ
jgi:hypothetical protein